MARTGVVVGGQPVVKTVIVQTGLIPATKGRTHVPLAKMDCLVAMALKKLSNRDLTIKQMHVVLVVLNHGVNPRPQMLASSKEGGP